MFEELKAKVGKSRYSSDRCPCLKLGEAAPTFLLAALP